MSDPLSAQELLDRWMQAWRPTNFFPPLDTHPRPVPMAHIECLTVDYETGRAHAYTALIESERPVWPGEPALLTTT